MLPLVIAAFPAVFVIHVLGVFLCRGSRIVVFISGRSGGNIRSVLPNLKKPFKLGVHLLHDGSVTTLVRVVLQCQTAVLFLQVRQRVLCPCEAVDKIFPVVKVKTEVAARHINIIFP